MSNSMDNARMGDLISRFREMSGSNGASSEDVELKEENLAQYKVDPSGDLEDVTQDLVMVINLAMESAIRKVLMANGISKSTIGKVVNQMENRIRGEHLSGYLSDVLLKFGVSHDIG